MKKRLTHLLTLILLIFPLFHAVEAQSWEREYQTPGPGKDIIELPNENLVFMDSTAIYCVDILGDLVWQINMPTEFSDNSRAIAIELSSDSQIVCFSPGNVTYLTSISMQGTIVSEDTVEQYPFSILDFQALPNNEFIVLDNDSQDSSIVYKYNSLGDTIWKKKWELWNSQTHLTNMLVCQNGDLLFNGFQNAGVPGASSAFSTRLDSAGNVLWEKYYYTDGITTNTSLTAVEAPDSSFLMLVRRSNLPSSPDTTIVLKMNAAGDSIAQFAYPGYPENTVESLRLMRTADGFPALYGTADFPNQFVGFTLQKLDWSANSQWMDSYPIQGKVLSIRKAIPLQDNGFASTGQSYVQGQSGTQRLYTSRYDSVGRNFANRLIGTAYYDVNANCIKDPGEIAIPGLSLSISGDSSILFPTNGLGEFEFNLDAGNYVLQYASVGSYWAASACAPSTTVNFPALSDTFYVDIPLTATVICPDLQVDIAAGPQVLCFANYFTVSYQNQGTDSAVNAYVTVTMPPSVTVDSTSIPYLTPQSGLVYEFPLGNLPIGAAGSFRIYTTVNCPTDPLTLLGRTECATAHIFPDSICLAPASAWDGASVDVAVECIANDSLRFVIRNTGTSAMTTPGGFIVMEDNILRINNTFQLGINDSLEFFRASNGSTWMVQADQRPGHPGFSNPLAAIEGCGLDSLGGVSRGFLPTYPQNDDDKFISIFCVTYVGSYDPNDKQAQPVGIGSQHYIESGTEIEYMIRFQNTGTFPATNVRLRDTIDPNLDFLSIRYLGGSHSSQVSVLPGGILDVWFPGIMLPDSTSDEPNSHGFYKFAIRTKAGLAPGTVLENRAGIYFDFNPVVLTNTVFHTITEHMFGTVTIEPESELSPIALTVFPNPFSESTTFRLSEPLKGEVSFTVRDLQGRIVHQQALPNPREFTYQAGALPSGLYLFEIAVANGRRTSGKMMIAR